MRRKFAPWFLVALLAVAAAGSYYGYSQGWLDRDSLQERISAFGAWAPVGFIALNIAFNLLTLPAAFMPFVAGYVFGPVWGAVFNLIGATTGASIAFLVARTLGREAIERRLGGHLQAMDAKLAERGFPYMLLIRLVPILPFNWVSYGAGVTGISFRAYVLATALGVSPGVAIYAFAGSAAAAALAR
jgi:uncharacterized membrane protein YdjX (TVP38/TMEM64 family)